MTAKARIYLLAALALTCSVWAQTTEDPWLDAGCSLAPESALRTCLGDYVSVPPSAPTGLSSQSEAAFYCNIYQQLANCWAAGTYCREWLPIQQSADKFCALADTPGDGSLGSVAGAGPTTAVSTEAASSILSSEVAAMRTATPSGGESGSEVPTATLSSVVEEASQVLTSIWNNDSGTDIPVISQDVARVARPTWTQMTTSSPLPAATTLTVRPPPGSGAALSSATEASSTEAPVGAAPLQRETSSAGRSGVSMYALALAAVMILGLA